MVYLLAKFFRNKDNAEKLAEFYFENVDMLTQLKNRYPDWESHVSRYLSTEVRAELRKRGVPL